MKVAYTPNSWAASFTVSRYVMTLSAMDRASVYRLLGSPRDDLERRRVGAGHHVRLLDPGEPLDGAAVEAHALGERALELLRRDGEGLQEPQDVGEPQADEPDPAFLHGAQDVL